MCVELRHVTWSDTGFWFLLAFSFKNNMTVCPAVCADVCAGVHCGTSCDVAYAVAVPPGGVVEGTGVPVRV